MTRRSKWIATLACLATLAACKIDTVPPRVGPLVGSGPPPAGVEVAISGAEVAAGKVAVTLAITEDDLPLDGVAVAALRPAFTLAGLAVEPVSGLPAWRSYLPLGPQNVGRVPVAGPGTPEAEVLLDQRQPGAESATPEDLGGGLFRYEFATALPAGYDPGETLRVGVFLQAVSGKPATTATFDFVPSGAAPEARELVLDQACGACHGTPSGHEGTRMGARICVTCHTFQSADPDTMDPAALAGETTLTHPNPLELGRLVHRIHRGRNLPTLYRASSTAPAPALPSATPLPLPFFPGRNAVEPGRKFSVVGEGGHEVVFGEVRTRSDNGAAARTMAAGIWFPRDYRDCDVCHAGAAQSAAALAREVSRRSCAGCHPETWFGATPVDTVHFPHPGGPQPDDTGCAACHVRSPASPAPYAPLDEVHVAPIDRVRPNVPVFEIVSVRNMRPGEKPTITFKVTDRNGVVSPLGTPTPAMDQGWDASPVPRAFPPGATGLSGIGITLGGPVAGGGKEYAFGTYSGVTLPYAESVPATAAADPASGFFTYTFNAALPAAASGMWTVTMAGRRSVATPHYSVATDSFTWPYTGESVTETADQAFAHVDVSTGAWDGPAAGGSAPPAQRAGRPAIVSTEKCNVCHGRLAFHGGTRNQVESCLTCHTPDRTDWNRRPKDAAGNVDLAATYDDLEEQSVHFKVMIHRIHTGSRHGSATLEQFDPYVIYGYGGTPYFFGDGTFPDDLARCDRCHLDGTWAPEAMPVADVSPTIANESATVLHSGTVLHDADPAVPPLRAACTSCHANAFAASHAARNTSGDREQCLGCHGAKGTKAVSKVHGVPEL